MSRKEPQVSDVESRWAEVKHNLSSSVSEVCFSTFCEEIVFNENNLIRSHVMHLYISLYYYSIKNINNGTKNSNKSFSLDQITLEKLYIYQYLITLLLLKSPRVLNTIFQSTVIVSTSLLLSSLKN